jgi:hypothetical protein
VVVKEDLSVRTIADSLVTPFHYAATSNVCSTCLQQPDRTCQQWQTLQVSQSVITVVDSAANLMAVV